MSRETRPENIPVTARGAAARDDMSDTGPQPPSDRTLTAGAQAAEAMRQSASSSSAAAAPTATAVTVDKCTCRRYLTTTTANGRCWITTPTVTVYRSA